MPLNVLRRLLRFILAELTNSIPVKYKTINGAPVKEPYFFILLTQGALPGLPFHTASSGHLMMPLFCQFVSIGENSYFSGMKLIPK